MGTLTSAPRRNGLQLRREDLTGKHSVRILNCGIFLASFPLWIGNEDYHKRIITISASPKTELEGKMHPLIVQRALEISKKRRAYLDAMRRAIQDEDKDSVFELARKLTGLNNDEERHRTDPRIN